MNSNRESVVADGFSSLSEVALGIGCTLNELLRIAVLESVPLYVPYADEIVEWNGKLTGRSFSVHCRLPDYLVRQLMATDEVMAQSEMLLVGTPSADKNFKSLADALLCFVPAPRGGGGHFDVTPMTQELRIRRSDVVVMGCHVDWFKSSALPSSAVERGAPAQAAGIWAAHQKRSVSKAPPPIKPLDTNRGPDLSIKYEFKRPNWDRWRRSDLIRLWEGACIAANFEPPLCAGKEIWAWFQIDSFPAEFYAIWDAVNRDMAYSKLSAIEYSGRMLWQVPLGQFANWAIAKGFIVPQELREIAASYQSDMTEVAPQDSVPDAPKNESKDPEAENRVMRNGAQAGRVKTVHRATQEELIKAFSCRVDLFRDGHKFDWFKEARLKGSGGKNAVKPTFDPYLFAVNLPGTSYGRHLTTNQAWSILERRFPDRYLEVESYDPRTE